MNRNQVINSLIEFICNVSSNDEEIKTYVYKIYDMSDYELKIEAINVGIISEREDL